MTPSIIRRLLNYHGIVGAIHWSVDDAIAALANRRGIVVPNEREVIQALTRIEDAERLLAWADGNRYGAVYRDAARGLLVLADIDPDRWAAVK